MNNKILISKDELESKLRKVSKKNKEYKNIVTQKPDVKDPIETINWLKDLLTVIKK